MAQPSGTGVIAGTVVESSSGDPVRKAIVTVTWHGTPKSWATARTDGSGKFRFENLPAGIYDLRAEKDGGGAIYGANSVRETGENITLADGETRDGLKLRFLHAAGISGHVFGPDGEPVIGAQMNIFRGKRNLGRLDLLNAGTAVTDDQGEYHINRVDPGQYYAFVSEFNLSPSSAAADIKPPEIPVGQYYGGAADTKDATVLVIHDGETIRGIDFHIGSEPAARIQGHITGVPKSTEPKENGGSVGTDRFAQVSVRDISGGSRFRQGLASSAPDWAFSSGWIAPGQYRVKTTVRIDDQSYSAYQIIQAHSGINDVTLAVEPSPDIKGTVRMEGKAPKGTTQVTLTQPDIHGASVGFRFDGVNEDYISIPVPADGHFTINQVPCGQWELDVRIPQGAFLKSARFGDQDARFKSIQVKPGPGAALDILISTRSAKVHGVVDASGGDPARAGILLVPIGDLHEIDRFYYVDAADDHGKFELTGIAPGKYKVFAFEKLSAGSFRGPDQADQLNALLADFAEEADLTEDANVEIHPKLVPLERARVIAP